MSLNFNKYNNNVMLGVLLFCVLLLVGLLSSCSNTAVGKVRKNTSSAKGISKHTHEASRCMDEISHTHSEGAAKHRHIVSCDKPAVKNVNAHSHKTDNINGFYRHVHPNGSKKHKHN